MNLRSSLFCLSACLLVACGNTGAQPQTYEVDGQPVLRILTDDVIIPEHHAFAAAGDALVAALQTLADVPDADALTAAQSAWRDARKAYRHLDALHFGPGYSLFITERIDVGPVDAPGIDSLVDGTASLDDAAVAKTGGKKKGFLGLEYLLFAAPAASGDEPPVLAQDTAAARRRALALSMADEIAKSAHQLDAAWDPTQGGYAEQLALAGAGSTQYTTQRAAVDDLVGGVGYALELVVGVRLAEPLGKHNGGMPAPELDPTWRSDNALADIQASLEGALALYSARGLAGVVAQRSADLNRVVGDEFTDGQAAIAAIPAPFGDTLSNDTPLVEAAYDATKALKQTWSTDVASALGATVRPSDIDGD
jgi:predicted lipoprotein